MRLESSRLSVRRALSSNGQDLESEQKVNMRSFTSPSGPQGPDRRPMQGQGIAVLSCEPRHSLSSLARPDLIQHRDGAC